MLYEITAPATLSHTADLPSSKSVSNRALIIHALSGGGALPQNLSDCDDTEVMTRALRDMPDVIDIKAAGTAMRFMTAYLAVTPGSHTITGTERMRHRPIGLLVDALRRLGAEIEYTGEAGFPPLRVTGRPLDGGQLEIPGNVSSQYISALMMIGPVLRHGLRLHLTGEVISRPYIDMTLWIMGEFGADARWTDPSTIAVEPRPYSRTAEYVIENDWSAASYWYEAVALGGAGSEVTLTGLTADSKQGDASVRYIFSLLGVKTAFVPAADGSAPTVRLTRTGHCVPRLEYDFVNSPDLAQTFVVCCAALGVPFRFTGLQTLKIKETDRIEALKTELRKLGYVLHDTDGRELLWDGSRCPQQPDAAIDTYDDHRMALSFAPLAMRRGSIRIACPQVVSKSYPRFWDDLAAAGFGITRHGL